MHIQFIVVLALLTLPFFLHLLAKYMFINNLLLNFLQITNILSKMSVALQTGIGGAPCHHVTAHVYDTPIRCPRHASRPE